MKRLIQFFRRDVLIKIAAVNSFAIFIRVISGFLTSKAIAIFVGVEGMALIGNFRDFFTSVQSLSTLGFSNGIVKYVSEFRKKTVELSKTISTVFYLIIFAAVSVSLYCYFNAEHLNDLLFTSKNKYSYVIKIMAFAVPFYAFNVLLLGILNGLSQFERILYINVVAQIVGMLITLFFIWQKQLEGALMAVATVESIIFLITIIGAYNQKYIFSWIKFTGVNFESIKKLSAYSAMALFTALTLPLIKVTIRNYIIDTQSLHDAGLWESMNRISSYYLMFITTLLTLYLLPRFAEIETKMAFRKEVFRFYKTIMPIFGLGLIAIYFLRLFIIKLVLNSEFAEVESFFFWQLLGDFVKVFSIVIAYQFLAKRMFWHYIITESISMVILYFASIYYIDIYGAIGATIAHFVEYCIYLMLMLWVFRKSLFGKLRDERI